MHKPNSLFHANENATTCSRLSPSLNPFAHDHSDGSSCSLPNSRKKKSKGKKRETLPRRPSRVRVRRSRIRLRRILPGAVYLLTKKTNDDYYFLRPDGSVDPILLYLLVLKLKSYGLLLHAFIVMSNHIHLVVTDVRGRLPDFMRDFLSESSKAIQLAHGMKRRVWSSTPYSATRLLDRDAAERLIAYCQTNPTKAGLTMPMDWPGLTSAHYKFGATITARKPERFFGSHRPDVVECRLSPLLPLIGDPDFDPTTPSAPPAEDSDLYRRRCEQLQASVQQRVDRRVEELLHERRKTGRRLAGREAVQVVPRETRGQRPLRKLNPKFASRNPKLMEWAKASEKEFRISHEVAKQRYARGESRVLFPAGTYGYRELLQVRVRKAGVAA